MSAEQATAYPSKVDVWLVPVLCLPPLTAVAVIVTSAVTGSMAELLIGLVMALFVVGIYVGLVFPMQYQVGETHLVVRFGICRRRIPLAEITEVRPSSNPLSAPALSLSRLRVQFGRGPFRTVFISPVDRDQFLDELAQKAGLKREGVTLVRA